MRAGSTAEWPDFPFCGERCKLIDLGRWLGEAYRVPVADDDQTDDGSTDDPGDPDDREFS